MLVSEQSFNSVLKVILKTNLHGHCVYLNCTCLVVPTYNGSETYRCRPCTNRRYFLFPNYVGLKAQLSTVHGLNAEHCATPREGVGGRDDDDQVVPSNRGMPCKSTTVLLECSKST